MNIHESQLFWCELKRGTLGFDPSPYDWGNKTIQHQLYQLCFGENRQVVWPSVECKKNKKEVTHLHNLHVPVSQPKSKHDHVPTGSPGQEPKLLKAPPFHVAPWPIWPITDGRRSWSWELSDAETPKTMNFPSNLAQKWFHHIENDQIFSREKYKSDQVSTARCSPIVAWCANPAGNKKTHPTGHVFTGKPCSSSKTLGFSIRTSKAVKTLPLRLSAPYSDPGKTWSRTSNKVPTRSQHGPKMGNNLGGCLNNQQPISFQVFSCGGWTLNQSASGHPEPRGCRFPGNWSSISTQLFRSSPESWGWLTYMEDGPEAEGTAHRCWKWTANCPMNSMIIFCCSCHQNQQQTA